MVDEYLFESMQPTQGYEEPEMRKNIFKACRLGKQDLLVSTITRMIEADHDDDENVVKSKLS